MGYWENIESQCYQTMCNRTGEWDLIIMDEIDFAVGTPEYGKCLLQTRLKAKCILGMTGFITQEKEEVLESFYPICFKANIEELQDNDILNQSEFVMIEYPVSTEKTIEQKMKTGKSFFVSENDQYKYWDKQFQQASIVKSQIEKRYRLLRKNFEAEKDWMAVDWKFKIAASKRKKILHTLESTITVTKNLIEHIHSRADNKVLIFSTLTQECDKLPNPYHGKSDEDAAGIDKLNSGEIKTCSVVKKVTRGVNLVGVNYLIRAFFDGSETELQQSHGRLMRLKVGQIAKYIILLPLYQDLVKVESGRMEYRLLQTQAERWKNKMMQSLNNPTIRTIRLDKTLKIKEGIVL